MKSAAQANPGCVTPDWLLVLAALGAGAVLWTAFCTVPGIYWNPPRFAPSYALAAGLDFYATRESAQHLGWHYGPVFPLWSLPAAFVPQITLSFLAWAALNLIALVGPTVLALRRLSPAPLLAVAFWAAMFCAQPHTQMMLYVIHVDALATGLGLLAALAAHRAVRDGSMSALCWAALCAVLALWTKQVAITVPAAIYAWLLWRAPRPVAARFFVWCAVWGGVTTALFFWWFGGERLLFNLWLIHARTPLRGGAGLLADETVALLLASWVWLVAGLFLFIRRSSSVPAASRPSFAGLLLVLAVAHVPLGVSAVLKEGGGWNSLHSLNYLLPVLAIALADRFAAASVRLRLMLAMLVVVAHGQAFMILHKQETVWAPYRAQEDFLAQARAEKGRIYFPWNPLLTLITERKVYPFDNALFCLAQARLEPDPALIRAAVPPAPLIIYHEPVQGHFALRYFAAPPKPISAP